MNYNCNEKKDFLTTNEGMPVSNDTSSLTVGERGPVLLQDIHLLQKISHFDKERIPERVVHAKGAGAFGHFRVYKNMSKYTMAKFLEDPTVKTPVLTRFSTVIGSKGSADTARDPRGFAVKFYTEDGNYDLAGNDIPVFFIRDAMKFPDVIHSLKPSPDTNTFKPERFWDFVSLSPEATHMITWLYSDRGTIKSYRKIEGFSVNTYTWINKYGKKLYVKYHWKPMAGIETISREEAELLAGINADVATKDLYDTLDKGEKVQYELQVQLMDPKIEDSLDFDPLDATKVWPESLFPFMKVGMMTLDKAPKNFFAEIEQAAFCPSNIIPGIGFSNDKLLQARIFSYHDTQQHRLGANFEQLPVNRPNTRVSNNQEDGNMRYFFNKGPVNYYPNSLNNGLPKEAANYHQYGIGEYVKGIVQRKVIRKTDDFTQAGERYRSLSKTQQDHLICNIAHELWMVNSTIQDRVLANFSKASKEFGCRVKKAIHRKKMNSKMNML